MVMTVTAAFSIEGAAAEVETRPAAKAPTTTVGAPIGVVAPAAVPTTGSAGKAECVRVKGARACVGLDQSALPGITIEDTRKDKLHPAVEYYQNGYLGTKYVIHNLAREGEIKGNRRIGNTITFRAAVYRGDRQVKVSEWKTVRDVTKHPVKPDTRLTPASARARSEICTSTKGAASLCFGGKKTVVFACDTGADRHQARAEYFLDGDPTARFEIHQLAGMNTCGKAVHGDLAVSMYRASVFDNNHQVATRLYKYN
ncbi:hypothetical protein AB0B45_00085 [Nonomuraea sp. NPDC049152]|uniref:hypothetical protein n=1 Tax=Nonomuraea sp. NPDC049152 TaxID=3154350 RepID=UPI0033F2C6C0